MNKVLQTRLLSEYKDQLTELTTARSNFSDEEFNSMMRCFVWYSHDLGFQDIYETCEIAMPVLAGYVGYLYQGNIPEAEYEDKLRKVVDLVNMLGSYLDEGMLTTPNDFEEPTGIVNIACQDLQSELLPMNDSLILFADLAIKTQQQLFVHNQHKEEYIQMLQWPDARKIERLQEEFMNVSICKDLVYNLIRREGKQLLHNLTDWLYQLHPADQVYLLHGLDAFPKNRQVIALYNDFMQNTDSTFAVQQVEKYLDRVARGLNTTS